MTLSLLENRGKAEQLARSTGITRLEKLAIYGTKRHIIPISGINRNSIRLFPKKKLCDPIDDVLHNPENQSAFFLKLNQTASSCRQSIPQIEEKYKLSRHK
jgi:hypothetical protein